MNEINYLSFIQEVKEHIVKSRYIAARLVNREQLLLYFLVGKRLSEKSDRRCGNCREVGCQSY